MDNNSSTPSKPPLYSSKSSSPKSHDFLSGKYPPGTGFDQRRRQDRLQQQEKQQFDQVMELSDEVEQEGAEVAPLIQQSQQQKNHIAANEEDNLPIAHAQPDDVVRYGLFVVLVIAAYVISLLLIYAGTAYLVGLLVGSNQVLKALGVLLVPITLVGLQLAVGTELYRVKEQNKPEQAKRLAVLKQVAVVLVTISPAMVLATFLAETWGEWPLPPALLLLVVRMLFAFTTDVCLVRSGGWALEATSWLLFNIVQWRLKRRLRSIQQPLENGIASLVQKHRQYQRAAADFHHAFPNSHRVFPDFSLRTRFVLRGLMCSDSDQV